jgi:hypothetical protein
MATSNVGLIALVVGAILAASIALVVATTGHAPPSVLVACAQVLQSLSRVLLWILGQQDKPEQRDEPDQSNPRSA